MKWESEKLAENSSSKLWSFPYCAVTEGDFPALSFTQNISHGEWLLNTQGAHLTDGKRSQC